MYEAIPFYILLYVAAGWYLLRSLELEHRISRGSGAKRPRRKRVKRSATLRYR